MLYTSSEVANFMNKSSTVFEMLSGHEIFLSLELRPLSVTLTVVGHY